MTVSDLIEKLSKLPGDADVWLAYAYDGYDRFSEANVVVLDSEGDVLISQHEVGL